MSGIYIRGIEMPTEEYGSMDLKIYPNGKVVEYLGDIGRVWDAIHVPPHGRLGDLDALEAKCTDEKGSYFGYEAAIIGGAVSSSPTIIPADLPKEETE